MGARACMCVRVCVCVCVCAMVARARARMNVSVYEFVRLCMRTYIAKEGGRGDIERAVVVCIWGGGGVYVCFFE